MLKGIAPIPITFVVLVACGAYCQKRPSTDLLHGLQFAGSTSYDAQSQERIWNSLPDAPSSGQLPMQAKRFRTFVDEASLPLALGAVSAGAGVMHDTILGHVAPGAQPNLTVQVVSIQKESSTFFGKYLYTPTLKQYPRDYPSTNGSLLGRASYAASRMFITRDDSGKGRLNTWYLLGVLTSVALNNAFRPSWERSTSATFNNFGSKIGSDAGMNVLHEFSPGIHQMVKGLTPKSVARIDERVIHDQTPKTPSRSP